MSITVLELTQQILSSMDSDSVASIGDTAEATQVATLIKEVYEEIVYDYDIRSVKQLFQLNASTDPAYPTKMTIPSGYHSIEWIRYNARTASDVSDNWVVVSYLPENDFIQYCLERDSAQSNIVLMPVKNNITIPVLNDVAPYYWTTLDDTTVIFDSFDSAVGTTLLTVRTNCYGSAPANLILADTTIIGLPARFISMLRNEVRARAFDLWKDGVPAKIEQAAMRSRVRLQRQRYVDRLSDQERNSLPNYGKQGRGKRSLGGYGSGTSKSLP
jgi:hypothetical protein